MDPINHVLARPSEEIVPYVAVDVFLEGGRFRIFLHCHLGPEPMSAS